MSGDLWATVPQSLMWLGAYYPVSRDCGLTNNRGNWSLQSSFLLLVFVSRLSVWHLCREAGGNDTISRLRNVMRNMRSSWSHEASSAQFMSSRLRHRESIKILVRSDFIQQLRRFSLDDRRDHNASLVSTSDKAGDGAWLGKYDLVIAVL